MIREMGFVEDNIKRFNFQSQAEEVARKLVREFKEYERSASASSSVVLGEEIENNKNSPPTSQDVQEISSDSFSRTETNLKSWRSI